MCPLQRRAGCPWLIERSEGGPGLKRFAGRRVAGVAGSQSPGVDQSSIREATVIAVTVFGAGATIVHIMDTATTGNLAPGNTLQITRMDSRIRVIGEIGGKSLVLACPG